MLSSMYFSSYVSLVAHGCSELWESMNSAAFLMLFFASSDLWTNISLSAEFILSVG